MDTEIELILRGHGLLDFVDDEPAGEGQECVEVHLGEDLYETLYPEIGLGEQVVKVLGDWLDGHSEFHDVYSLHRWAFDGDKPLAVEIEIRKKAS